MHLLKTLFGLLKDGGLHLLFILIFLEGNPIVGSFIPGQILVIFIGFLISTTKLYSLWITIIVVLLASFLGDMLGYYMGRKYGIKGLKVMGLNDQSTLYKSSYSFFKKYGPWSIIMGREFNFTRAFMPFFAGCFNMKTLKFIIYSFFGCIIWTVLSISLGYYFGFLIIDNFNFIMEFFTFLIIYIIFVTYVYRSTKSYYIENFTFLKKYAIHNFFILCFLMTALILMSFLAKWGYITLFNDYFSFVYFPSLYSYFGFLTHKFFLTILFMVILFTFLYKKEYKITIIYIWSLILSFLMTMVFVIFFEFKYHIEIFLPVVFFTVLTFFLWIILKVFFRQNSRYKFYLGAIIVILLIMFLSMFSTTGNFFCVLLSFTIGVFHTEFILLLSYYQIFDKYLFDKSFDKV